MRAGPEVVGEGVDVGGDHGLDAGVDDGEGVVGPEVAADVGEVLVFEEELVAEVVVEHELGGGRDELGDSLVEDLVPFAGVAVLGYEELEERIWAVAESFEVLEVVSPDGVLVVGEALDTEQVPGPECVEQESFFGALSARSHFERLGRFAF